MSLKYLNILVPAALAAIGVGLFVASNILGDLHFPTRVNLGSAASAITFGGSRRLEKKLKGIIKQTNATIKKIAEAARITGGVVVLLSLVYAMIFCFWEWWIKRATTTASKKHRNT